MQAHHELAERASTRHPYRQSLLVSNISLPRD